MKENVVQFIGSFHQGGSERQAIQMSNLLREDGTFNVFVATLNKEGVLLNEFSEQYLDEIPEFKLTSFFDFNFIRQVRRCSKWLRENNIDVVHTHDFYTNVFGIAAARLSGIEVKIASKRETEGVRTKMQKRIENRIFRVADAIVANSESVKAYLVEAGVFENKIDVIHNGVDFERLEPAETDRSKIAEMFGLPQDEKTKFIAHVANLRHRVKNQEMALRAAARSKEKFPHTHYIFAGEGERKDQLKKLAGKLGISEHTHFIGRCGKIPELLAISDICILTSTAEGFSNSILEYMFAGKPVVATNVGGANEAIVDGKTGFLVDSYDDDMLAAKISELLGDDEKARAFGEAGKSRIENMFSLRDQLKKTMDLYQSVMAKN